MYYKELKNIIVIKILYLSIKIYDLISRCKDLKSRETFPDLTMQVMLWDQGTIASSLADGRLGQHKDECGKTSREAN